MKTKGHNKKYPLNEEVKVSVKAASDMLAKVKPDSAQDETTIQAAMEELEAGTKALLVQQKMICTANHLELGWQVVDAYDSDELASGNEDAKHLKKAGKVAEQIAERRRKKLASKSVRGRPLCWAM